MTDTPRKPSPVLIGMSVLLTLYLLYRMFLAGGEPPSTTLHVLRWVVLLANIGFLGTVLIGKRG